MTAQKRAERAHNVPIALSVFDQGDLDKKGIEDIDQLQVQVPSLVADDALPDFTLRGVSAGIVGPGSDAGFSIYQNGVYASRIGIVNTGFYDLERVEILRGPQGTLYGRNATGGVMNIITRRPSDRFEAGADYEYGSYDKSRVRGVLNAPIGDLRAAARLAFLFSHHRGYYDQLFTDPNQRSFDRNDVSVRSSLYWEPISNLRGDLSFTFVRQDGHGLDHKLLGNPRTTNTTGIGLDDFGPHGAGNDGVGALPSPASARSGNENQRQIFDRTIYFATLKLTWDLGDLTLTSITGFQDHELGNSFDGDQTELDIESSTVVDDVRSWSTELNLLFDDGGPFHFLLGIDYFDEKVEDSGGDQLRIQQTRAIGPVVPQINTRAEAIQQSDPTSPFKPFPDDFQDQLHLSATARNRTAGTFADATYHVSERWRVRGGLRYSFTHRKFADRSFRSDQAFDDDFLAGALPFYVEETGSTHKQEWNAASGRFATDFDLNQSTLLYASVSSGNRPGGFTFLDTESFRGEDVIAVELGSKSTLFDQRLRIDTSAFYSDYDDIQVQVYSSESMRPQATNIPSAEIFGVELAWLAEPLDDFVINGSFGWLKTRIDKDFIASPASACLGGGSAADACPESIGAPAGTFRIDGDSVVNLKGNQLARSPELSLNIGAQYSYELAPLEVLPSPLDGVVTLRFDYVFRDEMFFDVFNREAFRQGSWDSGNLRLLYDKRFEGWGFRIEGYANNLWDEEVLTNVVSSSDGLHEVGFYNQPRSFGVRVTGRWK